MNKVIISGRWTRDIEVRTFDNGTMVARSAIAVDEGYGDKKQTHFFEVEMWGKTAETAADHSGKGRKVLLDGRMKQERWEKDGTKYQAVKVVADRVEFLDYKDDGKSAGEKQQRSEQKDNGGFNPFYDDGKPVEITDDDLPF